MQLSKLLLLFFCAFVVTESHEVKKRLPRNILPYMYKVTIIPDLSPKEPPFPVEGNVNIHVRTLNHTKRIVLNSYGPIFEKKDVKMYAGASESPIKVLDVTFDKENEFVIINVDPVMRPGQQYVIQIGFRLSVNSDRYGLHYSPYIDNQGQKRYLLATQLEPIGARRMMPCFDEVDMKAKFDVQIVRKKNLFARSNGRKKFGIDLDGNIHDYFVETPEMSIYLLAMVVGDLKFLDSPPHNNNYNVQTVTTERFLPYSVHPNKYYTVPLQEWLENVTKIPYEMAKQDHVVLQTFGGAMENWGLITYSEKIYCVNNETSSAEGKLRSAYVIAHELAHMWYGNLATCAWWTHLWVQEGLASYYNFQPLKALGWDADALQQSQTIHPHLLADEVNTTTPVRIKINQPQDATQSFSLSTYEKGAALLRMVENILSKPVLEKALNKFLLKFSHGSANSDDMLNVFTQQAQESGIKYPDGSPIDFKKFLDPWLDQKGYPLLKVDINSAKQATVSQSRYLNPRNQTESVPSEYGYRWEIPLTVVDKKSPSFKVPTDWMKINQKSLNIKVPENDWFVVNPSQGFFYRVLYDQKMRELHSKRLTEISPASRAQIYDDSFSLTRNGYYNAETALDNTWHLKEELYYPSWDSVLRHLGQIQVFFQKEGWFSKFRKHFTDQASAVIERIGEGFNLKEALEKEMLRKDLLGLLVSFGDKKFQQKAMQKFTKYIQSPQNNPVNANEIGSVACHGISQTSQKEYDIVKKQYDLRRQSPIIDERNSLVFALTCSPRNEDLDRIFKDVTSGSFFESDDITPAAAYLAATPHGEKLLFEYLDKSWESPIKFNKGYVFSKITQKWYTKANLDKLKAFIKNRKNISAFDQRFFALRTLNVEQNIAFYDDNVDIFKNKFEKLPSFEESGKMTLSHLSSFSMFEDLRSTSRKDFLLSKQNLFNSF